MMTVKINDINLTTASNNHLYSYKWSYYAALPTYITFMVLNTWILISLILHGITTGKWSRIQVRNPDKLNSGLIYTSVIVCACFGLVYHSTLAVNHYTGYNQNELGLFRCNWEGDFIKCVYSFVVLTVNVFLWLRQRVFYSNTMSNARFGSGIKIVSGIIIFSIFAGGLSGYILTALPKDSIPSPIGCVYKPEGKFRSFAFYIIAFIIAFGQIALVSLLIFALMTFNERISQLCCTKFCCCRKPQKESEDSTTNRRKEEATDKTSLTVQRIIQKTVIFAILSLTADTLVLTLVLRIKKPHARGDLAAVLASLAVFLNLLFMILSFLSWRKMITSPCRYVLILFGLNSDRTNGQSTEYTVSAV